MTMKRLSLTTLFIFCFVIFAYAQKAAEPKLVGTWRFGYDDYGEFIYHKVEAFAWSYLKENPNAKMVARLCSGEKMSVALASSDGFAFIFPAHAKAFQVPAEKIFFARWSKCESRSEQYWFVPGNDDIEYDEMVQAERVRVNRFLVGNYDNPNSPFAKSDFAKNLKEFIAELKNNPKAEGFIIRNNGMRERHLREALRQLRIEKIDKNRFQILSRRTYPSYYPELMAVTITE
jgi:hypothetical protein